MGISPFALEKLIDTINSGLLKPEEKSVLQLGKQLVSNQSACNEILRKFNLPYFPNPGSTMGDIELFKFLGFESVSSLDASAYEGADYIHDMNMPVSRGMREKWDVIFDGGTLEHVFDVKQSLENIHSMLRTNGVIIHVSPSNNHVDHGFYQFSPTLFFDFYSVNAWEILEAFLFEYHRDHDKVPWKWYKYKPGVLDSISFGGLNSSLFGCWFVAKKSAESRSDVVPQQGTYKRSHGWLKTQAN